MKKLVARRGQLELGEVFPDQPVMLIGRSPACDMVLRAAGVAPVHFILEWVGEGDFDPQQGFWSITSVKGRDLDEENAVNASASQGVVIGPQGIEFEGFTWAWMEDSLSRQEPERGQIRRKVEAEAQAASAAKGGVLCLEVIRLSPDGESVVDVEYLDKNGVASSEILRDDSNISVNWGGNLPSVRWTNLKVRSLGFQRSSFDGSSKELDSLDLLLLKGGERSYLLRLVPRLQVPVSPSEMLSDPVYKWLIAVFILGGIGLSYMTQIARQEPPPPVKTEQRIAKVEIKEAAPPPPPPPPVEPPPPAEEPPPPAEKEPTPAPPPVKPTPKPVEAKPSTVSAPAVKSENKPVPKAGLNSPAKVEDVNAVGLLGSMKKAGSSKTGGTVSADMIVNNGIVTEAVTGAGGAVLVQQPPTGIVDMSKAASRGDSGQEGQDALMGASTTLSGGGTFDLKSNGPIGRKGGMSGFSIGTSTGDESTNNIGLGGRGEGDFGESVVGGLSREAVRRAVSAHRREIRACYERALIAKPKLKGRVVFKWYISPEGPVTSIHLEDSEVNHPQLEGCVMGVIKGIMFPKAPNGQATTVIYPFMFQNL